MKAAKILSVVAVLGLVGMLFAQDAASRPARGLMGQITKVDGAKITVKPMARPNATEAPKEVVVTTDDKTVVTLDGKDAKVSDLKADLYVRVTPADGTATKIVATTEKPQPPTRRARPTE